jgi:SAM-dependent methyltransferase
MKLSELKHHQTISSRAEQIWGWDSPAGCERARRRADLIIQLGGLQKGKRALELGCGTGIFSTYFAATGVEIIPIDICEELLVQLRRKLPSVQAKIDDAENLSFPDSSFDAVVGSSVLHHLDVDKSLKEIWRVLKPGGRLALAEPNMLNPQVMITKNVPWIKRAMGDSEEETAFFRWPLQNHLMKIGFQSVQVTPFDFLHPLIPASGIPLAKKIGAILEKVPLFREIAGSLLIGAQKPF